MDENSSICDSGCAEVIVMGAGAGIIGATRGHGTAGSGHGTVEL